MSKLINVSDEVYEELKRRKRDSSFSVVITRLLKAGESNKERILAFAGSNCIDEKKVNDSKKEWKKWSKRYA
ncbi:MAG: hypothetical protein KKD18_02320 [Nanoarchaeota archaeon]|nr:hypothetical protein [Nanoarchaeota archaeon]MBU0977226.1 hypothetical protein [Nanoarchaeota archaeon]